MKTAIIKKAAHVEKTISKIDPLKIGQFINQLKNN